jgi:predicted metal-dependent hydrolase
MPPVIVASGFALTASLDEYAQWSDVLRRVRSHILPLIEYYNLVDVAVTPRLSGALTFNKNDITMCVREDYSIAELSYVMLHEYAHVINTTYGHTPEYWRTFEEVLAQARAMGIRVDSRFATQPYCR